MFFSQTKEWLCDRCNTQITKNGVERSDKNFYRVTLEGLQEKRALINIEKDLCELCALEFTREYLTWLKKQ